MKMTRHRVPYTMALTVEVRAAGAWLTCERLGSVLGEELVYSCEEIRAVLGAQGRLVARLLAGESYEHFRIIARAKHSGALVGGCHWARSAETGRLAPAPELAAWTACDYGQHGTPVRLAA